MKKIQGNLTQIAPFIFWLFLVQENVLYNVKESFVGKVSYKTFSCMQGVVYNCSVHSTWDASNTPKFEVSISYVSIF